VPRPLTSRYYYRVETAPGLLQRHYKLVRSKLLDHTFSWHDGLEVPMVVGSHTTADSQENIPWTGNPLSTNLILKHDLPFDPNEAMDCPLPHQTVAARELLIRQTFQDAKLGTRLGEIEMRFVSSIGPFSAQGNIFGERHFKLRLLKWTGSP